LCASTVETDRGLPTDVSFVATRECVPVFSNGHRDASEFFSIVRGVCGALRARGPVGSRVRPGFIRSADRIGAVLVFAVRSSAERKGNRRRRDAPPQTLFRGNNNDEHTFPQKMRQKLAAKNRSNAAHTQTNATNRWSFAASPAKTGTPPFLDFSHRFSMTCFKMRGRVSVTK